MSPLAIGAMCIVILLVLLALGVHLAIGMFVATAVGISLVASPTTALRMLAGAQFTHLNTFTLIVIPLFLLMSSFASAGTIGTSLFEAARIWLGRLPGGVAMASVAACTMFAAASGSSAATCAAIGRVCIPQMLRQGYSYRLAAGVVGSAGTLGLMIPPSVSMVVFGMLTGTSIGKLLIGGVLPGLSIAAMFMVLIMIWALVKPQEAPRDTYVPSWKVRAGALRYALPILVLVIAVMGSIYLGFATPTEAAGMGSFAALLIAVALGVKSRELFECTKEAVKTTSMIIVIVVAAMYLSQLVARVGIPTAFGRLVVDLGLGPWELIGILTAMYFVLGMILDGISMQLLTLPIVFEPVVATGIDPIWFGVYVTLMIGIAQITPPVGLNLYVLHGINPERPLTDAIKATVPFYFVLLVFVLVLLVFPELATFLPSLM